MLKVRRCFIQLVIKICFFLFITLLLDVVVFGVFRSTDDSMAQAVKFRDLALIYRLDKQYYSNDLTVYEYDGLNQIRRVIARSGDSVDITEAGLVINGQLQSEPNIYEETMAYEEGVSFPLTLKEDEVFLLADSRENAVDSRYYGPVKISDTKGTVVAVLRHTGL